MILVRLVFIHLYSSFMCIFSLQRWSFDSPCFRWGCVPVFLCKERLINPLRAASLSSLPGWRCDYMRQIYPLVVVVVVVGSWKLEVGSFKLHSAFFKRCVVKLWSEQPHEAIVPELQDYRICLSIVQKQNYCSALMVEIHRSSVYMAWPLKHQSWDSKLQLYFHVACRSILT